MPLKAGVLCLIGAVSLIAQSNLAFENAGEGSSSEAWRATVGSYAVAEEGCVLGKCIALTPASGTAPGTVLQSFDATPYRGKLIRFRSSARVEAGGRAQLWLRVDRKGGMPGFFDNMAASPIADWDWSSREIDGFVHDDADKIFIGFLAYNKPARFDEASFTVTGELPQTEADPARPLTSAGLRNLEAFARLAGLIRHFHPSDQAASADWNRLFIEGAPVVEQAESLAQLAAALLKVLSPVAPTLRVYSGGKAPAPHPALMPAEGTEVLRWRHKGYGGGSGLRNIYSSERVRKPGSDWKADRDIYTLDCGGGVTALVPIAVFADPNHTLPAVAVTEAASVPSMAWTAKSRATRLAAVILAWNVFQHFYPYFDVVKTDWSAALPKYLQRAASDQDDIAFHRTLRAMIADLKDGHGSVNYRFAPFSFSAPLRAEVIENKLIVTGVGPALAAGLRPGDEIVQIGDTPAADAVADAAALVSGATPQWIRNSAERQALSGPNGKNVLLAVRSPGTADTRPVIAKFEAFQQISGDARPKEVVAEPQPGIWYVDLTRAQDPQFESAVPKLAAAKGIVFDMRGYPRVTPAWFSYVTKEPLSSAQWHVPLITHPGKMEFERGGEWNLQPKTPYLSAKKVFLTNGSAISYAESTMGIVEHYKLGEIIGEATAGTNGNVISMQLPGGYQVNWTGMKVLKHDGSQHHMIGNWPTIPLDRTQAGVAAGRDELLERALKELSK